MPTVETKASSSKATIDNSDTIEASGVSPLPYLSVYLASMQVLLDHYQLLPLSPFFTPFFTFVALPVIDYICGRDDYNPSKHERKILENRPVYKYIVIAWGPYFCFAMLWACWIAWPECDTLARKLSLVINMGIGSGININMAHELIHKHPAVEQWLGRICLCLTSYGHFAVEHLLGHHVNVSTHDDPASSRKGESLYAFLPRSIINSFISAIHLDAKTTAMLWAVTFAFAFLCIPSGSIGFFFIQGLVGACYLEVVNYIEHYGLSREPGEPVTPMHSWNAGDRITNYLLVKLQRHSDHHSYAGWRYQTLRSWPHSPQLPFGYATMIVIALFPPIWFKMMDPRVEQVKAYYKKLESEKKVDEIFTDEYLQAHPEDMKLKHWEKN